MTEAAPNLESLLRAALSPIDPPADLLARMETRLSSLTEIAVEELESWELSAMRDPRNWVRPAAAVVVGGTAGAALIVLRARHQAKQHPRGRVAGARDAAGRALHDATEGVRRMMHDR
jgi:hypothetical protein